LVDLLVDRKAVISMESGLVRCQID